MIYCSVFSHIWKASPVHDLSILNVLQVAIPPDTEFEPLKTPEGKPAKEYPFILDPFQKEALLCLENNQSVLVSAHTSAGKTVVAVWVLTFTFLKYCLFEIIWGINLLLLAHLKDELLVWPARRRRRHRPLCVKVSDYVKFSMKFSSDSLQICCMVSLYHTHQYVGVYKLIYFNIFLHFRCFYHSFYLEIIT